MVWASSCITWKYYESFFRRVKRAGSKWLECVAIFANATLFCSRMFHSDQLSDIKFEQMKFLTTNSKFQLNIELVLINTKLQNFSLEQYGWSLSDCPILVNPIFFSTVINISFKHRDNLGNTAGKPLFHHGNNTVLPCHYRGNTMVMS